MALCAEEITIAITVYNRRDFVLEAIGSALAQTIPVRVIVVDNGSPDLGLQEFILARFGDRIQYHRNAINRGMFDNWNACMEYCGTPWLSILHDDDLLHPGFVATMIQLVREAPNRALYFGHAGSLIEGERQPRQAPAVPNGQWWAELDVIRLADECFLMFPGQLFQVAAAQALGGFKPRSYGPGDWDMWFRLAVQLGGVFTIREVALNRFHYALNRGTSRLEGKGWKWALDNVQRKRNLRLLARESGRVIPFDRTKLLAGSPVSARLLIRFAPQFSRRILAYNAWLFTHSRPPGFSYAMLQWLVRLGGPKLLLLLAWLNRRPVTAKLLLA